MAIGLATITTDIEAPLKQYYASRMENLTYENHVLMGLLPKSEGYGEQVKQPIMYGNPQGRSATFTNAQANMSSFKARAFLLDWFQDYGLAQIDNANIELAKNDKGSLIRMITAYNDGVLQELTNTNERDLFRSGWGDVGTIGAISGSTITLANRADVVNFSVGQVIVLSATQAGSALRSAGATITVAGVDRDAGIVTFTAGVVASIAAAAVADYMFTQGDRQDSATPSRLKIAGLGAWLPLTAPVGGDNFFGVDRSVDTVRLAGCRLVRTGVPVCEAFIDLIGRVAENGGNPDKGIVSLGNFVKMTKELGNQVRYVDVVGKDVDVSFSGIEFAAPGKGKMVVTASVNCPDNVGYALQTDTWNIYAPDKTPVKQALREGAMLDVYNGDKVEIRNKSLMTVGCAAPGFNGVVQLA